MINDMNNLFGLLPPLATKRIVMAQVAVCQGCCCGNIGRGKPEVPVEWLKQEWRSRGLSKFIQFTVSGCLGPCDLLNIVRLSTSSEDIWLGKVNSRDDFEAIVNWAAQCKCAGDIAPLPPGLLELRFNPFRPTGDNLNSDYFEAPVPIVREIK